MDKNTKLEFANYLKFSSKKLLSEKALPEILLQEIERKIRSYSNIYSSYKRINLAKSVEELASKDKTKNISTGFESLDKLTEGLSAALIVLGSRPGMGKTAFLLSMACAIAEQNRKVAIVFLEMSAQQITSRIVKIVTETNTILESSPSLSSLLDKYPNVINNIDFLEPMEFDIHAIESMLVEYHKENTPDIILLDYLQLIHLGGFKHRRQRELNYIIGRLKNLSRTLDIPIIVTSQLSRAVETRGGEKRPQLSDLRESGSMEQDADMVWFLYRAAYYSIMKDEDGMPTDNLAELIIAKNKNGLFDTVKLHFNPVVPKFSNITPGTNCFATEFISFQKMDENFHSINSDSPI